MSGARAESAAGGTPPTGLRDLPDVVARVLARKGAVRLTGLRGAARAAIVAELARGHGARPVLCISPTARGAEALHDDLRAMLGESGPEPRLRFFPRPDVPPFDRFSPQDRKSVV